MILLESCGHSAVFLDHNQFISNAYSKNNSCVYSLKSDLFNFKPKPVTTTNSMHPKTRKRKAGAINISAETLDLKNTCEALLTKLKQTTKCFSNTPADVSIERVWEEPTVWKVLKGSNTTDGIQSCIINSKEYLFPAECRFFNHDLLNLKELIPHLGQFDFVVMDPPWRNKYIRRIKKAKRELSYKMMHDEQLSDMPINELIHNDSIVAIWCTNSQQHQRALLELFLPRWDLCLLHKITWLKLNTEGNLIGDINEGDGKQPYEVLFIARHRESQKDFSNMKKLEFILSVPSIIHSHKPPILELFRGILPQNPTCLELFARYLQPSFTSVGLEVLKLMDTRLYSKENSN